MEAIATTKIHLASQPQSKWNLLDLLKRAVSRLSVLMEGVYSDEGTLAYHERERNTEQAITHWGLRVLKRF